MTEPPKSQFVSSLDDLASAGERWLWKSHLRDGIRVRLPLGIALLLLIPILALAIVGLGWIAGQPWKLPTQVVLILCPLPSLIFLGYHLLQLWRQHPGRREGLAVFDETLDLKDRLQTADEFLGATDPTPFMEAAIEDAGPALEKANQQPLDWDWGNPWPELRRLLIVPALAAVLLVIAIFLPSALRKEGPIKIPGGGPIELVANLPVPQEEDVVPPVQQPVNPPEPKEEKPEERMKRGTKGETDPAKINENPSNQLDGRDKISVGTSEGGQTSQAASSGRASQSRGMPGSQAPSSRPEQPRETKKRAPKPGKEKETEKERKEVKDKSGATAGRGSSGGSSRNPASTDWASKDRTESADNEEFEQEEDVDDEESESEARGGLQPNLRDRRPPVNRDLSIGFGNMASQDSNGRGGPGQRKKSRGVAGLVLGVPIPDHVKGQPNPGRVKVNQERVQPQGEDMPEGEAEDRGQRSSPAGHLSERTLNNSKRQIVRDYFLKTRAVDALSNQTDPVDE